MATGITTRQRPYLGRKAKAEKTEPTGKPKKRPGLHDVTNRDAKRKRMAKKAAKGHKIMTRARSRESTGLQIFDDASTAAPAKDSERTKQESRRKSQGKGKGRAGKSGGAVSADLLIDLSMEKPRVDDPFKGLASVAAVPSLVPSLPEGVSYLDDTTPVGGAGYAHDIHENFFVRECDFRPSIEAIRNIQTEITDKMRTILLDWLVEVAEEFRLNDDTLYLCNDLIDRSMSVMMVTKSRLQLLGCACLLLASKYEEIQPPAVDEFAYISDNTYTSQQVLKMEAKVLSSLSFQLTVPTVKTFLSRFIRCAGSSKVEEMLTKYIAELGMLDIKSVDRKPSLIAAGALYLARLTLKLSRGAPTQIWNENLEYYTHYTEADLLGCVKDLHAQHMRMHGSAKLVAINDKYAASTKLRVATEHPPVDRTVVENL